MNNDVLGREELECFDIDLSLNDITLLSTRCCNTGTCNGPQTIIPYYLSRDVTITHEFHVESAAKLYQKLGPLAL